MIRRRLLHCFGAGESRIEEMLPDLIRRGRRPTVGITASKATITLRIAADGATEEECLAAIAPVEATIRECLGTLVFGEGDDELQHAVVRLLRQRGKTLATAECGTAGLMAAWLSSADPMADVFHGGLVFTQGDCPNFRLSENGTVPSARPNLSMRWQFVAACSSPPITGWPWASPLLP